MHKTGNFSQTRYFPNPCN